MSIFGNFQKLIRPFEEGEGDETYEGARPIETVQTPPKAAPVQDAAAGMARFFAPEPMETAEPEKPVEKKPASEGGGILGGFKKPTIKPRAHRERTVDFGGSETSVILFNPKSFDEATELISYLEQRRSLVLTLEGVPTELARRLLDFISGMAIALQSKVTPISGKTYFITPQNVDVLGAQGELSESDGQYL